MVNLNFEKYEMETKWVVIIYHLTTIYYLRLEYYLSYCLSKNNLCSEKKNFDLRVRAFDAPFWQVKLMLTLAVFNILEMVFLENSCYNNLKMYAL